MLTATSLAIAALGGLTSGLRFHLYVAMPTSALAAGVAGYPRSPRSRVWWAAGIVLVGWTIGEGLSLAQWATGNPGMFSDQAEPWVHLAVQSLAGVGLGYALPAVTGAYIGRLVHKGTGYLSAAMVAASIVPALASIGGTVSALLERSLA